MRMTLLLLTLVVCSTAGAQGDPSGDPTLSPPVLFPNPQLCDLSGDWYPIDRNGQTHMRTNHTLARIRLRFTNTTTIGFEWNLNFIQFMYFSPGTISWRIIDDTGSEWQHGYQIFYQTILRTDLDPLQEYMLEVYTTSLPFPAATVSNAFTIERYRDHAGLQGAFIETSGVLADTTVQFLPATPEHPILEAVIYGDSLADGVVPISTANQSLSPQGAMASWPRKAVEYLCDNLSPQR